MTELSKKIYEIVRNIPEGEVMTYGRIAEISLNQKGWRLLIIELNILSYN